MAIDAFILKKYVIEPTLQKFGKCSDAAINLLLGTCAVESSMGTYTKQINGPALGIFQCEEETYNDIFNNFLIYRKELMRDILLACGKNLSLIPDFNEIKNDYWYAAAICRVHYMRVKEPLPDADDVEGMARYWKKHYNTEKGKGTVEDFVSKYYYYVR